MKREEHIEERSSGSRPTRATRTTDLSHKGPEFRINAYDLEFLRSLGIDPTRRLKSRRSRR